MRILSWNLAHQTREAPISGALAPALKAIKPDVLILNEFVDGASRDGLRALVRSLGLAHIHCSKRVEPHNQVLIASLEECVPGDLIGPRLPGGAGESNLLHVRFTSGAELVGLRAPTYKGKALGEYWSQLVSIVRSTADRPIAWIGDLNADPDNSQSVGGRYLASLERDGWSLPRALGPWSFYRGSRIDHILTSKSLECSHAEYIATLDGRSIAGAASATHVSDHAALLASVSLRLAS